MLGGPPGALVGAVIGYGLGKAFNDGSEALRAKLRLDIAAAVSETQRKVIEQAKIKCKKTIEQKIAAVSVSLQNALAEYVDDYKNLENARPDCESLSGQCIQSMSILESLRGPEA